MTPSANRAPVLSAVDVAKSYGAVEALKSASIDLVAGEVHGLVGDNGAGKSTLLKVLAGAVSPQHGRIAVDGAPVTFRGPHDALEAGIETVYQDLALVDTLTAAENVFLGREKLVDSRPLRWLSLLDLRRMRRETRATLDTLGVHLPSVNASVASLSGGQRQCLAMSRAMIWGRRVVILDEPTAALGVRESAQVLDVIRRLRDNGVAVLVVSHNMDQLVSVADRFTVMRLGQTITTQRISDVSIEDIVGLITGAIAPPAASPDHAVDERALTATTKR